MTVRIAFGLDCRGSAEALFWSSIGSQRKHLVALGEKESRASFSFAA